MSISSVYFIFQLAKQVSQFKSKMAHLFHKENDLNDGAGTSA